MAGRSTYDMQGRGFYLREVTTGPGYLQRRTHGVNRGPSAAKGGGRDALYTRATTHPLADCRRPDG